MEGSEGKRKIKHLPQNEPLHPVTHLNPVLPSLLPSPHIESRRQVLRLPFFLFLCSFSWFLFVHADSETPSRRGCDPNYSTERFGALSTWSSSCVSSVEKKKEKSFPASFFFLLVGHLITAQPGRITLDCEVFSVFSVPSSRFLFT